MKRNYFIVLLIMAIFVAISFVTNIMDPLGPDIKASLGLSLDQMGSLTFGLFLAYAVMSIPSGILVEKFSAKAVLIVAFLLSGLGTLVFASHPGLFRSPLLVMFSIGVGFAMLQVVINPLLRSAGGEEHYAFFGNLSQLVFALGSAGSPYLCNYLLSRLNDPALPRNGVIHALDKLVGKGGYPWVSLYWVFTIVLLAMFVIVSLVKLPKVELQEDEKVGSFDTIRLLLKSRTVWLFFIGITCYVGTEQGVALFIKEFLTSHHKVDPELANKVAVAGFWGAMAAGCALGLILLKLFDSKKILLCFASGGIITLLVALFTRNAHVALVALPLMGFWCSVGWPLVFSLALNSVEKHHGAFAGILCTGIVGGSLMPKLIGHLGAHFGLQFGMLAIVGTLGYLLSMGIWARPLIANATIGNSKETQPANV